MAEDDILWVGDLLFETSVGESFDIATARKNELEKRALKIFKDYYKTLASRGLFMDVEEPAAALGVDWEPISKKWASYKKYVMAGRPKGKGSRNALGTTGNMNRFYFGISAKDKKRPSLMAFVAKRDAFKDFGRPTVTLGSQKALRRGVQVSEKTGRPYYQKRKYGRGFAKMADAFDIFYLVEITGFPNIDGKSEGEIMARYGDGKMAGIMRTLEFGGPGIKGSQIPARPLFIPYLRWFINEGFQQLMDNV